jgi:hypothetical protein
MLETILSVSGKPGLYKMISQGKNLLIVESLKDKKRIPAYTSENIVALDVIEIYTNDDKVPLYSVLNNIKEKENLNPITFDISKATPDELRAYLGEVLPEFDRERVYPTDIKRLLLWYNILIEAGINQFDPEDAGNKQNTSDESEGEEEAAKPKEDNKKEAKPKQTSIRTNTDNYQKTATPAKQPPVAGKMRQRTKQK